MTETQCPVCHEPLSEWDGLKCECLRDEGSGTDKLAAFLAGCQADYNGWLQTVEEHIADKLRTADGIDALVGDETIGPSIALAARRVTAREIADAIDAKRRGEWNPDIVHGLDLGRDIARSFTEESSDA